jgi:RluA family pseudouridine synthase
MDTRKITTVIDHTAVGKRIDVWLTERFTYYSRHQWQKLIKEGLLLVNNKKIRASKKLQIGEIIDFYPQNDEPDVNTEFSIIYEDEFIYAVNKPHSLPCHPAGPYFNNTLWKLLQDSGREVFFVNRIDRETSGVVLIAKQGKIAGLSTANIIEKKYNVIVYGSFPEKLLTEGYLFERSGISRNDMLKVRKKRFFSYSKPDCLCETAKTNFSLINYNGKYSMLEAELFTGRMHQIRATLNSLGFPLLGDKLYGPDETIFIRFINDEITIEDENMLVLSRQALHAKSISFTHPINNTVLNITAPLHSDMQALFPTL